MFHQIERTWSNPLKKRKKEDASQASDQPRQKEDVSLSTILKIVKDIGARLPIYKPETPTFGGILKTAEQARLDRIKASESIDPPRLPQQPPPEINQQRQDSLPVLH